MTTRNSITFSDIPAELTLSQITSRWPALSAEGEMPNDRDFEDLRSDDNPDGSLLLYGESKHRTKEVEGTLLQLSATYPDATITWTEEWLDEEPSTRYIVIRRGERVRAESTYTQPVPEDLPDLIQNLREALVLCAALVPETDPNQNLRTRVTSEALAQATILMNAVDPRGIRRS